MKIGFEGGLIELTLLILLTIVIIYWGDKRYDILTNWINKIKLFPPFWLVFFPAIITYFFVCGSLSVFTAWIYTEIVGKSGFEEETFLMLENVVEFFCSLIMPILYFAILKRNNFSIFWSIILTSVHIIVAGYRDARFQKLNPLLNDGLSFESGPGLLKHFEVVDASFPLISLLIFLIFINKYITSLNKHEYSISIEKNDLNN